MADQKKPAQPARIIADNPKKKLIADRDHFRFSPFVGTFTALAINKHNETPFTVVIDGPWGCGKTTMMEMTKDSLEVHRAHHARVGIVDESKDIASSDYNIIYGDHNNCRPCKTFWFNAWKYSGEDSILSALILTMFKEMESDQGFWDAVKTKIDPKSFWAGVINSFGKPMTGLSASDYFHELKIGNRAPFLHQFLDLMKTLINSFCSGDPGKEGYQKGVFAIFIDDLDRCPPDRVLETIEAIKLFLDIPGCVFFLGMEVERVKEAINAKYVEEQKRASFNVNLYMEKIIQIHVKIPDAAEENLKVYVAEIFQDKEHGLGRDNNGSDHLIQEIILSAGFKTQRGLKRAVNDFLFMEECLRRMEDIELTDE
ncbi:MAG: KAP family NTPase [Nitrospinota bacterium]|nr:KAP family NTPase [Nitrospinota bacterium]